MPKLIGRRTSPKKAQIFLPCTWPSLSIIQLAFARKKPKEHKAIKTRWATYLIGSRSKCRLSFPRRTIYGLSNVGLVSRASSKGFPSKIIKIFRCSSRLRPIASSSSVLAVLCVGAAAPAARSPAAAATSPRSFPALARGRPDKGEVDLYGLVQHLGVVGLVDGGPSFVERGILNKCVPLRKKYNNQFAVLLSFISRAASSYREAPPPQNSKTNKRTFTYPLRLSRFR